ncbi:hypothetical protein QPK14_25315 [Photorhabdus temperata subsp. temperata]
MAGTVLFCLPQLADRSARYCCGLASISRPPTWAQLDPNLRATCGSVSPTCVGHIPGFLIRVFGFYDVLAVRYDGFFLLLPEQCFSTFPNLRAVPPSIAAA